MTSKFTKHDKRWYHFFLIISILLNIIPEAIAAIYVWLTADKIKKYALIACVIVALILLLVNIIAKTKIRSAKWIVFFGLYYALYHAPDILTYTLIAIGICTIVDDLIITPIYKHFKFNYKSNKVIDMRIEDEYRNKISEDK